MIMNYITKIKANITIYASKKTSNILDGTYKSIYKGKSMNFEDLRTYVVGDNVKDIDWKASARSGGNLLIRQYIAEKKHNIMLVLDTGKKMIADTECGERKKDVAIMSAGIISYIANKNGDYVGAAYNKNDGIQYYDFKSGLYNIERILTNYESEIEKNNSSNIDSILDHINTHIKKRMIILVVTDLEGMKNIDENTLKKVSVMHDIMFVNVNDAYMTGDKAYDVENSKYIPKLLFKDAKLHKLEVKTRRELQLECKKKLEKYKIQSETIDSTKEIVTNIINLLERHRYANIS